MKKIALAILTFALAFSASAIAQPKIGATPEDSTNCLLYMSYYQQYYNLKQNKKDIKAALPQWRKAYATCLPTARQTLLIDGETFLRSLIRTTRDADYRNALMDSLWTLHAQRVANFPNYAVTDNNGKGQDLINYTQYIGDKSFLFNSFEEIIAANGAQTDSPIFVNDLQVAVDLYKDGKLGTEEVINCYQRNSEIMAGKTGKNEKETEAIAKAKSELETLLISSEVASCDKLIELFTPRYDADPDNIDLVKNILSMMNRAGDCQNNDLYYRAASNLYKLEPSASSAYFLYQLNKRRGNVDAAIALIDEAIASPESDAKTDAQYSYDAATLCYSNGRLSKAGAYARQAIELDDALAGKCYMMLGNIWAGSPCHSTQMEVWARYWVASDYYAKAKNADPSLADEANANINRCAGNYPETADVFMYDYTKGQSYTLTCNGMSATTTVRTK